MSQNKTDEGVKRLNDCKGCRNAAHESERHQPAARYAHPVSGTRLPALVAQAHLLPYPTYLILHFRALKKHVKLRPNGSPSCQGPHSHQRAPSQSRDLNCVHWQPQGLKVWKEHRTLQCLVQGQKELARARTDTRTHIHTRARGGREEGVASGRPCGHCVGGNGGAVGRFVLMSGQAAS